MKISIRGAREHYLKNIDLDLPHHQFIVVTGLSGSGKSSLVMDTLYREGRRRYFEFIARDLRTCVGDLPRPHVDLIEGLPPVFFLGGSSRARVRSTVGTLTEIQDLLRLLFSKAGDLFCYRCGRQIRRYAAHQIVDEISELAEKTLVMVLAPLPSEVSVRWLKKEGFVRLRVEGKLIELDQVDTLKEKEAQIVVDRLVLERPDVASGKTRLADSIELALRYGAGVVQFSSPDWKKDRMYSTDYRCLDCGLIYGQLPPGFFSFNTPHGACQECHGLGVSLDGSRTCPKCQGARLRKEVLSVRVGSYNIHQVGSLSIPKALTFLRELKFSDQTRREVLSEISGKIAKRLELLAEAGLGYLNLNRDAKTLSAGELQRVQLVSNLASGLVGVLYILDEPTVGLHPKEVGQLLAMLRRIRDQGNTVIAVEHDEAVIRAADTLLELGPGPGPEGGRIVAQGTLKEVLSRPSSLTARLLEGKLLLNLPRTQSRLKPQSFIVIQGAREHNLKNIDIKIPLAVFCCVTGVSGAGKSTLVEDILCKAFRGRPAEVLCDGIVGLQKIEKLVMVDSDLPARSSRSIVATLVGIFDQIRELFSRVPESRLRGYSKDRFSFNGKGGRCEICQGQGIREIEMHLLADIEIPCEVCQGTRYNPETLEVKYKGRNIAEVLEMTVQESSNFFKNIPGVAHRMNHLIEIGVGYLKLGQSSKSLSGGEIQRLKLASFLLKRASGHNLMILDEPTRGLHLADIEKLLNILFRLRDQGNSILVIEHHLEVIKSADYVIDLGPGAGEEGGYLVAQGTPEEIARVKESVTGSFLKKAYPLPLTA